MDWRDTSHFRFDAPYGKPTPLRSHIGEPSHKVCAKAWNAEHPGETRFVSDPPRRKRKASTPAPQLTFPYCDLGGFVL